MTRPMGIGGPYGNRDVESTLGKHDKVMLIAGGSGTGFVFPIIETLLLDGSNCPDVHVVIAVRNSEIPTQWAGLSEHWKESLARRI